MDFSSPKAPLPSMAVAAARRLAERALVLAVVVASLRFAYYAAFYSVSSSSPSPVVDSNYPRGIDFYASVFHGLMAEGYLPLAGRCICFGDGGGIPAVNALRAIGVPDVIASNMFGELGVTEEFDFVFVDRALEKSKDPFALSVEISKVLRHDGVVVVHTDSGNDMYSQYSIKKLFQGMQVVQFQEIPDNSSKAIREFVFKKDFSSGYLSGNCSGNVEHKRKILDLAEPIIEEEPLKPWITLKKNLNNIRYLPSIVDISFKKRYVYIDVGARSYGSSIGSWFRKQYPKQNHTFEIYAIEADKAFHDQYASKKHVHLLPFAAWVKNETLAFEINREHEHKDDSEGRGMGRIRPRARSDRLVATSEVQTIQGFDFASWLKRTVSDRDYVVMKMDVEGTEFDIIPRLFKTGTFCLVDELFLECHYNRWQKCCPGVRSPKYQNTYSDCVKLFTSLRQQGVLVHQWW